MWITRDVSYNRNSARITETKVIDYFPAGVLQFNQFEESLFHARFLVSFYRRSIIASNRSKLRNGSTNHQSETINAGWRVGCRAIRIAVQSRYRTIDGDCRCFTGGSRVICESRNELNRKFRVLAVVHSCRRVYSRRNGIVVSDDGTIEMWEKKSEPKKFVITRKSDCTVLRGGKIFLLESLICMYARAW